MAPTTSAASPQECGEPHDHGETPAERTAGFERPRAGAAGARLAARVGPDQARVLHSGEKAVSSARTLGRRRVEKGDIFNNVLWRLIDQSSAVVSLISWTVSTARQNPDRTRLIAVLCLLIYR
jgi:hypothetical protein